MKRIDGIGSSYDGHFHVERVCFERIFDAPGRTGNFSFEAAGKRQFGVMLVGGDVPVEGSHYAVALAEKGNWQTIMAWRDLSTGAVHLSERAWHVVMEYAWLGYFAMPLVLGMTLMAIGPWAALALLALALWGAAAYLRRVVLRNRKMEQALREVLPTAPPSAPPGAGLDMNMSWRQRVGAALSALF